MKSVPVPSLLWLVGLALLYTLYFARSLLMPVVVALLLALVALLVGEHRDGEAECRRDDPRPITQISCQASHGR